jgi:hypothetical protein
VAIFATASLQSARVPVRSGYQVKVAPWPSREARRPEGLKMRREMVGYVEEDLAGEGDVEGGVGDKEAIKGVDCMES